MTIGIGAGQGTVGPGAGAARHAQLHTGKLPRFVRNFAAEGGTADDAVRRYVAAVKDGSFRTSPCTLIDMKIIHTVAELRAELSARAAAPAFVPRWAICTKPSGLDPSGGVWWQAAAARLSPASSSTVCSLGPTKISITYRARWSAMHSCCARLL